jgi:uncharacterized protein YjiS (DUF1127 family)
MATQLSAATGSGILLFPIARRAVSRPFGERPPVSLLHPALERTGLPFWRLWLARLAWRRDLRRAFAHEPDSVLADFGLDRAELRDYVARPFWRP